MISIKGVPITPTFFPDGTSQVWKVPDDLLSEIYRDYTCVVEWEFEGEAELLHLAQLKTLLDSYNIVTTLYIPFLPYARQDKWVSNQTTFALTTFATLLNSLKFSEVKVLDVHCNVRANQIENLVDMSPGLYIERAFKESKANLLLFPDEGASTRYGNLTIGKYETAHKVRDHLTGEITGVSLNGGVRGKRVLIADDICDGGRTFVEVSRRVYSSGAKEVHLYVTHGLFSKGMTPLVDAGIKRIFTRKGEILPTSHGCWNYKKESQ